MHTTNTRRGFTLVELLVVVLIVGILSALALPQYNKAVRKARLSEVTSTFNALDKGLNAYMMENGGVVSGVTFLGTGSSGAGQKVDLDVAIPCVNTSEYYCYTKLGAWGMNCLSGLGGYCEMYINTKFNANKSEGNKWLDGKGIRWWKKAGEDSWEVDLSDFSGTPFLQEMCEWWNGMSRDRREGSMGVSQDFCSAYF